MGVQQDRRGAALLGENEVGGWLGTQRMESKMVPQEGTGARQVGGEG